jgi:hypothetical protein
MIFALQIKWYNVRLFHILFPVVGWLVLSGTSHAGATGESGRTSVFVPLTIDYAAPEALVLIDQKWKADLYDGYAAVSATYWFSNSSDAALELIVGFPGQLAGASYPAKQWLRIQVGGSAPFAARDSVFEVSWQCWTMKFQPGVTEVQVFYGLKTEAGAATENSHSNGGNSIQFDVGAGQYWKAKPAGELWIQMNGGYTTADIGEVNPAGAFLGGNAILYAGISDLMGDSTRVAGVRYRTLDSVAANLYRISWESKFSQLSKWNPDEGTLSTLDSFVVHTARNGYQDSNHRSKSLRRWKWFAGISLSMLIIALLIWPELRSRRS